MEKNAFDYFIDGILLQRYGIDINTDFPAVDLYEGFLTGERAALVTYPDNTADIVTESDEERRTFKTSERAERYLRHNGFIY